MKETVNCLREYAGLKDAEQPGYLIFHGKAITLNAGTFPEIPNDGAAMIADGNSLVTFYAMRNSSDADMTAYTNAKTASENKMEANYDYIDLIAQGDGKVVELAGVKGTSTNTSRTTAPAKPTGVEYQFVANAGQIELVRDLDKLAQGSVIVTYVNNNVRVEVSADKQLKITAPDGTVILVDIETSKKALIKNLKKGDEIKSAIVTFNPNGLSPIASVEGVVVPR